MGRYRDTSISWTMFDQLFRRPHALAHQRNGPMVEERQRFLVHLARKGWHGWHVAPCGKTALFLLVIMKRLHLGDRADEVISRIEIYKQALRWASRSASTEKTGFSRTRFRLINALRDDRIRHVAKGLIPAGDMSVRVRASSCQLAPHAGQRFRRRGGHSACGSSSDPCGRAVRAGIRACPDAGR